MAHGRRMAIADEEPPVRTLLRSCLERMGHQVVVEAASGDELLEGCRRCAPDLVIADIRLPGHDAADAVSQVTLERHLPLVVLSATFDHATLERAYRCHPFAYLVKPIREAELEPAIAITLQRHDELVALQKETASVRQLLEDRKIIERAKGLLMKRGRIDEPEAFLRLRQTARQHRQKMVDVARSILLAEGMLTTGNTCDYA